MSVNSYLSYGLLLWGAANKIQINRMEIKQNKIIKALYGREYNVSSTAIEKSSHTSIRPLVSISVTKAYVPILQGELPRPV